MKDLIEDPALAKRGIVADVEHPQRGTFKTVGCPLVLSESPVEITSSPLLGEHTAAVLREVMGCDDEELERLRAEGVI